MTQISGRNDRYSVHPLAVDLTATYRFDEVNDAPRLDRSGNGNTMTDNNTVPTITTAPAGLVTAVNFTRANAEYVFAPYNTRLMPTANMVVSVWINLTTKTTYQYLCGMYDTNSGAGRVWSIEYDNTADRFIAVAVIPGPTAIFFNLNNFGAVTTGVWNHIMMWYEAGVGLFAKVNNGAVNSTANTSMTLQDISGSPRDMLMGTLRRNNNGGFDTNYMNGSIAGFALWKPTTTQLRYLTGPGSDMLYNGGNGMHIPTGY